MWAGHWPWWGFWFFPFGFFWVFVVVAFILRLFFFRRFGWGPCGWSRGWGYDRSDHEAVLRHRLASGEITEEQYERLRDLLRR